MNAYVVFLVEVLREVLGTIDRTVLPAGTTESDLQVGKIPLNEPLHVVIDQRIDGVQEGKDLAVFLQEIDDRPVKTGHLFVFIVLTRVVSRTAVEDIAASITGFINRKTAFKRERVNRY